jgi:hypothetical protein
MSNSFYIFLEKANNMHNYFYSYDKVNYINARSKVIITCPIHGEFKQLPYNHLMGKGCNRCSVDKNKKLFTKNLDNFIIQFNKIHNYKYNYEKSKYINSSSKIEIVCPIHGSFYQLPNKHINGQGCPSCKNIKTRKTNTQKYSKTFPIKSSDIHNNFYDYSKVNYINSDIHVDIICPNHGLFKQKPSNHLSGRGCPKCKQSMGENRIERYLIKKSIKYETQKKFNDCRNILPLIFDFWLSDSNKLIEFDGIQHYLPLGYTNGYDKLEYTIKCDKIKNEYCMDKNILLIRISYKDFNKIEDILDSVL